MIQIRKMPSACLVACALAAAFLIASFGHIAAQFEGNPPIAESKSCDTQSSPPGADPILLTLFDTATCTITLNGNADGPVSDGTVVVTLTDPASGAVLSCGSSPCLVTKNGSELDLACGVTAPAGVMPSASCTSVTFLIESPFAACLASPGSCGPTPNLGSTAATVQIAFLATPGNGGHVGGGTVLGVNDFSFQGPGVGTLLVTATPQVIPSNGIQGSTITATFACGSGGVQFGPNGFPLSGLGFRSATHATIVANQPVLGTGQSALCGAGLPGGFTFSAPRNILFDNGRSTESIGCGVGPNISPFGGSTPFGPYHTTAPLIFSCTGAAVIATGNGRAGDAPINATYQSAVGGLTAVGSTFLTVAPAQEPKVAVACSPTTINPAGPGSVCTATVTDQNNVPMGGLTGATVSWSSSDSGRAIVEACGLGTPGAINVTSSPNIIPSIGPFLPCQIPAAQLLAQNVTLVNGQAAALVVSPAGSGAGPVTISAALNVLAPPSSACLIAPYLPSPYSLGQLGAPAQAGCGSGNPVGFTGAASALSTATGTLIGSENYVPFYTPSGSQAITISATSGIQIAGSTPTQPLQLTRGCNQITVTTAQATPVASIAAQIIPTNVVVSMWRFNNSTKFFDAGYFGDPNAPTDFTTTGAPAAMSAGNPAPPAVAASATSTPAPAATPAPTPTVTPLTNQPVAISAATPMVTESYFVCITQATTIVSTN